MKNWIWYLIAAIVLTAAIVYSFRPDVIPKKDPVEDIRISLMADSMIKADRLKRNEEKLITKDSSPIIIVKQYVSTNSIGTPEANLVVKNVSSKIIDGVKVGILCYNNFDEPVNKSIISDNEFKGISQETVKAGKTDTWTWTMYSFDNTTKIKSYVMEVHFKDGSKWSNNGN